MSEEENFTKISRQKQCEKRKISRKFHSAGALRRQNQSQKTAALEPLSHKPKTEQDPPEPFFSVNDAVPVLQFRPLPNLLDQLVVTKTGQIGLETMLTS